MDQNQIAQMMIFGIIFLFALYEADIAFNMGRVHIKLHKIFDKGEEVELVHSLLSMHTDYIWWLRWRGVGLQVELLITNWRLHIRTPLMTNIIDIPLDYILGVDTGFWMAPYMPTFRIRCMVDGVERWLYVGTWFSYNKYIQTFRDLGIPVNEKLNGQVITQPGKKAG